MAEDHQARASGSASVRVLGQVAGPHRSASVMHAGPDAVYLDVEGSCTCLLSARATQVPCGIRTTLDELPAAEPGDLASVEHGAVTLGGLQVRVAGIVDSTVPVLDPSTTTRWSATLTSLADGPTARVRDLLPAAPIDALFRSDPSAVPALLGLGPGLTPLGDDVLGGWLATALATRHPGLGPVRSAVALSARERTTTLSATLLACASRGEVVPELRNLLVALVAEGADVAGVERAVAALAAVGDTSGAGALLGVVTALASAEAALVRAAP